MPKSLPLNILGGGEGHFIFFANLVFVDFFLQKSFCFFVCKNLVFVVWGIFFAKVGFVVVGLFFWGGKNHLVLMVRNDCARLYDDGLYVAGGCTRTRTHTRARLGAGPRAGGRGQHHSPARGGGERGSAEVVANAPGSGRGLPARGGAPFSRRCPIQMASSVCAAGPVSPFRVPPALGGGSLRPPRPASPPPWRPGAEACWFPEGRPKGGGGGEAVAVAAASRGLTSLSPRFRAMSAWAGLRRGGSACPLSRLVSLAKPSGGYRHLCCLKPPAASRPTTGSVPVSRNSPKKSQGQAWQVEKAPDSGGGPLVLPPPRRLGEGVLRAVVPPGPRASRPRAGDVRAACFVHTSSSLRAAPIPALWILLKPAQKLFAIILGR